MARADDEQFGFHPLEEVGQVGVAAEASVVAEPAGDGSAAVKTDDFLSQLDEAAVAQAIQQAESRTSGEIRVFVTTRQVEADDVIDRAASRFEKLGMSATRDRN